MKKTNDRSKHNETKQNTSRSRIDFGDDERKKQRTNDKDDGVYAATKA